MRLAGGYACWSSIDGKPSVERDTITCCHCNSVVIIVPKSTDIGGFCRLCMKPTCSACAAAGSCIPFEKKLEEIEHRGRMQRAMEQL